jgi:hypothetical protein
MHAVWLKSPEFIHKHIPSYSVHQQRNVSFKNLPQIGDLPRNVKIVRNLYLDEVMAELPANSSEDSTENKHELLLDE